MKRILILLVACSLWLAAKPQTWYKIENLQIVKTGLPVSDTLNDGTYYFKNFRNLPDSILEANNWRKSIVPDYDPVYQKLGEAYYDVGNDVVTWTLDSIVYNLATLKQNHKNDVEEVVAEISLIKSKVSNIYDPWGDTADSIPATFKALYNQKNALILRANAEINALSTIGEALNYVVRGPEVEAYISVLESFSKVTTVVTDTTVIDTVN